MIFNSYQPASNIATRVQINRPQIVPHPTNSTSSNIYRVQLNHDAPTGAKKNNYEVWATKEAIQKHFFGQDVTPYHIKKFARQMYEGRLKDTNGTPREGGLFVTTNQKIHGNPSMWPSSITDTEVKT